MIDLRQGLAGWGVRAAVAVVAATLSACFESVSDPSTDLSGAWDYSYSTRAAVACPPPAPPSLRAGCTGAGRMILTQEGTRVSGVVSLFGGCTSCASVGDSFGAPQSVTGQLDGTRLNLTSARCHLSATLRSGDVREAMGDVECFVGDARTEGTWRMSRAE